MWWPRVNISLQLAHEFEGALTAPVLQPRLVLMPASESAGPCSPF